MADENAVHRAMEMVDGDDDEPKMSMVGWTAERELLATIVDVLTEFHATFIQANSEKNQRPPTERMPRPYTALKKVETKKAYQEHRERVAMFLSGQQRE